MTLPSTPHHSLRKWDQIHRIFASQRMVGRRFRDPKTHARTPQPAPWFRAQQECPNTYGHQSSRGILNSALAPIHTERKIKLQGQQLEVVPLFLRIQNQKMNLSPSDSRCLPKLNTCEQRTYICRWSPTISLSHTYGCHWATDCSCPFVYIFSILDTRKHRQRLPRRANRERIIQN